MQNPVVTITDKVMRMIRSMVYLAMCVGCRRGATPEDIAAFLKVWAPSEENLYHSGVIERVLVDLSHDGRVVQAGARWYLSPAV
ncbi:MAG: hypothetical protein AAGI11_18450 [Pseudomonadota bacterium]